MAKLTNRFKTETIEETLRFFRDEVEFCLTRQYFLKPISAYSSVVQTTEQPVPLSSLPAWDSLTPVDMQNRWLLQVRSHVLQDNKPDEIRKVQDQLLSIRGELEGAFDFKVMDRKVHDTRIAQQQQEVQALPQKVMVGRA